MLRSPSFLLGATLIIPVRHPLLFIVLLYSFKDEIIRSAGNTQDRGILLICASSQQYFLLFGVFSSTLLLRRKLSVLFFFLPASEHWNGHFQRTYTVPPGCFSSGTANLKHIILYTYSFPYALTHPEIYLPVFLSCLWYIYCNA